MSPPLDPESLPMSCGARFGPKTTPLLILIRRGWSDPSYQDGVFAHGVKDLSSVVGRVPSQQLFFAAYGGRVGKKRAPPHQRGGGALFQTQHHGPRGGG